MIRGYVPAAVRDVKLWYEQGRIPAGADVFTVSDALRSSDPDADDEELEYLATSAAMARAGQIAAEVDDRPAVVAVDVEGETQVLAGDVPVQRWAAVFVDDMLWYAVEEVGFL